MQARKVVQRKGRVSVGQCYIASTYSTYVHVLYRAICNTVGNNHRASYSKYELFVVVDISPRNPLCRAARIAHACMASCVGGTKMYCILGILSKHIQQKYYCTRSLRGDIFYYYYQPVSKLRSTILYRGPWQWSTTYNI